MQTTGLLLSLLLAGVAVFQLLLALGLPLGKAAWGGKHSGKLPNNLRIASAVAFFFFIFTISVVLSKSKIVNLYSQTIEDYFLWFITVYFALGVVMNAVSRSKLERLWAPYIAVLLTLSLILLNL